jgi:hypothetical protein
MVELGRVLPSNMFYPCNIKKRQKEIRNTNSPVPLAGL